MEKDLKDLDDVQREAVITGERCVRVICGAGGGKTRVLTRRIAHLINHHKVNAPSILAVTFTNKAAREMQERVRQQLDPNNESAPAICTFHSWGSEFLKKEGQRLGFPKVKLIGNEAQEQILQSIYKECNINDQEMPKSKMLKIISLSKHNKLGEMENYAKVLQQDVADYALIQSKTFASSIFARIAWLYLYRQMLDRFLDLDDLILLPLYLLKSNMQLRQKWSNSYSHILVDEAQDINSKQLELLKQLRSTQNHLFMVGDPDQNIYSWRGADCEFLINPDRYFPNITTFLMERNYRSSAAIVTASNQLISNNQLRVKKSSIPVRNQGSPVWIYQAKNCQEEAEYIAQEIKKLRANGIRYKDIAVLVKAAHLQQIVINELNAINIPYVINENNSFFERKEVNLCLDYLRFLISQDDKSLKRIINEPRRGIGRKTINKLTIYAQENKLSLWHALPLLEVRSKTKLKINKFIELIQQLLSDCANANVSITLEKLLIQTGLQEQFKKTDQTRYANILKLKDFVKELEHDEPLTISEFLNNIQLYNSPIAESYDVVQISTIHGSKGLEFHTVFVYGVIEGILPDYRSVSTQQRLEEERRVMYEAMTRAKEQLHLTYSNYDSCKRFRTLPSRFIEEVKKTSNSTYFISPFNYQI